MKVIDLFCGLGGWVQSFPAAWDITGYDIMDFSGRYPGKFIKADLLEYRDFGHADLVVASPPCTDFSKASFPPTWKSVQRYPPDIPLAVKLFNRAREIIDGIKPQYWIIENVRGSQKYMGRADMHYGSRYLWTNMALNLPQGSDMYGKWLVSPSPDRPAVRAVIPRSLSVAVRDYIEAGI